TYNVNGTAAHTATIKQCDSNVQDAGCSATAPVAGPIVFKSDVSTRYDSKPPGVLAGVTSANTDNTKLSAVVGSGGAVTINPDGSFCATPGNTGATTGACGSVPGLGAVPAGTSCGSFSYKVQNAQGQQSNAGTAYVAFKPGSGLAVNLFDAK